MNNLRIITRYNKQSNKISKIISKHWHLLGIDPLLAPFVPPKPSITYRKTRSLKDSLTQSEYTGEFRSDPCKRMGTFRCGGCNFCQYMNTDKNIMLPNGKPFRATHFANCKTEGVVYLLSCQCWAFYIGKTKQPFHKRASRHILCMKKSDPDLPLGRHIRDAHYGKIPRIKFLILDRIHPDNRGGDWNRSLLQRETRWIVSLNATCAPGLNEVVSYRPSLEGIPSGGWWGIGDMQIFIIYVCVYVCAYIYTVYVCGYIY